jgi:hypothetical protein
MNEAEMIERDRLDGERATESLDASLAGIEYQIAKLDLKPGNILVVKMLRDGLNAKQMNKMQYDLQKFVGRKVLVIPTGADLSVIEGTKVPK